MSELRAPDPTLIDLHEPVGLWHRQPDPAIAHRLVSPGSRETRCGESPVPDAVNSMYAAWFAVPCRTCFPDAPEPGWGPCTESGCTAMHDHFGLDWQTQVSNRGGASTAPRETDADGLGKSSVPTNAGDRGGRVESPEVVSGRAAIPTTPLDLALIRENLRRDVTHTRLGVRCNVCRFVDDHGPGCAVAYALALADAVEERRAVKP